MVYKSFTKTLNERWISWENSLAGATPPPSAERSARPVPGQRKGIEAVTFLQSLWNRSEKPDNSPSERLRVERRRNHRHDDGRSTFIFPVIGNSREVVIQDASFQGMRLVSRENLEVGSRMHLIVFYNGSTARFIVQVLWEASDANPRKRQYGVRVQLASRQEESQLSEYLKFLRVSKN
ncbi:MAG: PilZ domain-containing protein [Armatimonadetes bacterium]|nr:PilZ domain-containing protein [Armatimonadota bacterium]